MTSLNNVHAIVKKQSSPAKQECELQHGYPYKTAEFSMGRSVQNLSLCRNMSILRLCVILGFIVTSYSVRRFLEEVEVTQAVALLESGYTQRIVAECFDVSRNVVARLWRHYQEMGKFTRREGQGRHRMTSQREDQYLRNLVLRNRQYTARRIQIDFQHAISQRISDQTICNRLH